MVYELAEVGVGRRDWRVGVLGRVVAASVGHGIAQSHQGVTSGLRDGQQIVGVVLELAEQEIEPPHIDRFDQGGSQWDVRDAVSYVAAGVAYYIRGDVQSMRQARHKLSSFM